jgi:hypothetical protein
MSAINSNWGWNKSWQRRQLRVPLNQRGGHLYPPILLASLNPTIHRPCENGRGVLYSALIHCPEIRNDDITISKFEGAASVRHKIAISSNESQIRGASRQKAYRRIPIFHGKSCDPCSICTLSSSCWSLPECSSSTSLQPSFTASHYSCHSRYRVSRTVLI